VHPSHFFHRAQSPHDCSHLFILKFRSLIFILCNIMKMQPYTITHCNTLQHTATQFCRIYAWLIEFGNTLQHTVIHHNTLQHTTTHYNTLQHTETQIWKIFAWLTEFWIFTCGICEVGYLTLCYDHTATNCNTLQSTATHYKALQRTATHCSALQRTATHCNALRRTATHCNALQHTDNY